MRSNLAQSLAYIDQDEGPELNIAASEPGGSSKHGVSMTVLREWRAEHGLSPPTMDDMRAVDSVLAAQIYTARFASPVHFDDLPAGVDYRLLDIAVNLGVTGGIHALQRALDLDQSGKMDAVTIMGAIAANPATLIKALGATWLAIKKESGGWVKYGPGWTNRANRAESRALAMLPVSKPAQAAPAAPAPKHDVTAAISAPVKGATMTWRGIIGRSFSPAEFEAYVASLQFGLWRPRFIVVHNTSAPDTKTWRGWQTRKPPITDEHWAQNLVGYYRDDQKWSAGPHLFITPAGILAFSPLTGPGTHSPAWNAITWGVETVGEFEHEPFTGPVRDNLVAALAILHAAAGLQPMPYERGVRGLHFHKEDPVTTHKSCPGKNMVKADLVKAVEAKILDMHGGGHVHDEMQSVTAHLGRTGTVITDDLKVRDFASSRAPVVATLNKGSKVTIVGETMNGGTKWLKVGDGYVAARYVIEGKAAA